MRYREIDILRGIAVMGVVLNHAIDGLASASVIDQTSWLYFINNWLYQFRMPAIAFTLGLFIPRSIEKYGAGVYAWRRVKFAVYIYMVWYIIQMGFELVFSRFKNYPIGLSEALQFWLMPAHLWFIPYIAVSTLIIIALKKSLKNWGLILALLAVVSLLTWGRNLDYWGLRGFGLLGFTALGAVIGAPKLGGFMVKFRAYLVPAGLLLGVLTYVGYSPARGYLLIGTTSTVPFFETVKVNVVLAQANSLVWALAGILFLMAISSLLSLSDVLARLFSFIGSHTIDIYLAHVIVVAGARVVLTRLGMATPEPLLLIMFTLGVAVPLILGYFLRKWNFNFIFEVPQLSGFRTR